MKSALSRNTYAAKKLLKLEVQDATSCFEKLHSITTSLWAQTSPERSDCREIPYVCFQHLQDQAECIVSFDFHTKLLRDHSWL